MFVKNFISDDTWIRKNEPGILQLFEGFLYFRVGSVKLRKIIYY